MKIKLLAFLLLALAGSAFAAHAQTPTPATSSTPAPVTTEQKAGQTTARTSPVGVGETAPDFTLKDTDGREVRLSAARGQSPVVLVFYRGYW